MRSARKELAALLAACTLALVATPAAAKSQRRLLYAYKAVWSTTIRLLRVDLGYKLTERDKDNGFILFVFPGTGSVKKCPASLEMVAVTDQLGRRQIQVQLSIAHQPRYVESHLLDKLVRKLRREMGPPRVPPKRKKPKKPKKPKKSQGQ